MRAIARANKGIAVQISAFVRVAFVLFCAIGPAVANESLGTAGPFRMVGGGKCDVGLVAQLQGQCDPPPIDPRLSAERRSQAEVERALELISLIRMDQAKKSLDAAIAADPRNAKAYKLRARMAIPGSPASAEADVNAGLLLAPSDSDLLATRAFLSLGRKDMYDAIHAANDAVAAKPDSADALWIRARVLNETDKPADAEADLGRALTVAPDHGPARFLRAQIRMAMDQVEEAAADASVLLDQNPADISARQLRAVARTRLGDLIGAIEDLSAILGEPGKPVNINPAIARMGELYLQRAILLVAAGRKDDGMEDLDTITKMGGPPALLRMQVYLRSHGFPDVPIDGKRSQLFDDAIKACFIDKACGRGLTKRN